jgi:hypothetical protein
MCNHPKGVVGTCWPQKGVVKPRGFLKTHGIGQNSRFFSRHVFHTQLCCLVADFAAWLFQKQKKLRMKNVSQKNVTCDKIKNAWYRAKLVIFF